MAKMTHEQAVEKLNAAKEAKATAQKALAAFKKENKITTKNAPEKGKNRKYDAAVNKLAKAKTNLETAQKREKDLRPAKERTYKYDYPADIKGDPKKMKEFRQQQRNAAKKKDAPAKKKAAKKPAAKKPAAKKTAAKRPARKKSTAND